MKLPRRSGGDCRRGWAGVASGVRGVLWESVVEGGAGCAVGGFAGVREAGGLGAAEAVLAVALIVGVRVLLRHPGRVVI